MRWFFVFVISITLFLFPLFIDKQASLAYHRKKSNVPGVSATLAKNKRFVAVSFNNLSAVKTISYSLTYNSTRGAQGVSGTIKPKSSIINRTLLLGTCSRNICVYHQKVRSLNLNVDFTLKRGGMISYSKRM